MPNATKKAIETKAIEKSKQSILMDLARDIYANNEATRKAIETLINVKDQDQRIIAYTALFETITKEKKETFKAVYGSSVGKEIALYRQEKTQNCNGEKIPYNGSVDLHSTCTIARIHGSIHCSKIVPICSMLPMKRIGGIVNHNRPYGELLKMLLAISFGA